VSSGTTQKYISFKSAKVSWTVARDACNSEGARLVSIADNIENAIVGDFCARYTTVNCWAGLFDIDNSHFSWDKRTDLFGYWNFLPY
jgi:hypothetical protein